MVPLILGAFLIIMAIIANRFYAGLGRRTQVPAWQGRTWLLLMGASLVVLGLAHLLHWSNTAVWQRVFDAIGNGYEVFVGGGMMLLGAVFAIAGKGKAPAQARWIALAASVAGAIFLFDGLTKIMN
jgi:hypothetical protein